MRDVSGNWTEQVKLISTDGAIGDVFGRSVSVNGNTALIGATFDDDNGASSGSAYIFSLGLDRNEAPIADAGPDQSVYVGDNVTLNGSGSYDPDGDSIIYNWTLTKPNSMDGTSDLSDPNAVNPIFSVDMSGTYTATLIVNDGTIDSTPDSVYISTINVAPIANAGVDQATYVSYIVALNGDSSYDPDGDPIAYNWSFTTKPYESDAELSDSTAVDPAFIPDLPGIYIVSLLVNDSLLYSTADTVTIIVITQGDAAIELISDLINIVNHLDRTDFAHKNAAKKFTKKFNSAIRKIRKGKLEKAVKILNQILKRTDGCAFRGVPDEKRSGYRRDLIVTCEAQDRVYPLIIETIGILHNRRSLIKRAVYENNGFFLSSSPGSSFLIQNFPFPSPLGRGGNLKA